MFGRVTTHILNSQFVSNLNRNLIKTQQMQDQLASGKIISKPSDDPVGITFSMRYRSEMSANQQHLRNLQAGKSWLEFMDSTLDQTTTLMQRVRELTVQAATDTNSQSSRDAIAIEVEQLFSELVDVGNTQMNGKYVFNGQKTDVKPYPDPTAPELVVTDNNYLFYEVGNGVRIPMNSSGNEVFGAPADQDNLFAVMKDLSTAIRSANTVGINQALERIDTRMDKVLQMRTDLGARSNRLDFIEARLTETDKNFQELLSKIEDANMAELITVFKAHESTYQASLATGAKIIQPTLIDFLR